MFLLFFGLLLTCCCCLVACLLTSLPSHVYLLLKKTSLLFMRFRMHSPYSTVEAAGRWNYFTLAVLMKAIWIHSKSSEFNFILFFLVSNIVDMDVWKQPLVKTAGQNKQQIYTSSQITNIPSSQCIGVEFLWKWHMGNVRACAWFMHMFSSISQIEILQTFRSLLSPLNFNC